MCRSDEKREQAISCFILSVFRLHGRLLEWGDALVAPLGLTSARWQILGAVFLAGEPLTAPQIAHSMGITRQGAQKQINLMMAEGYLQQKANPLHTRSYLYALTDQGRAVYIQADTLYATWRKHLAEGIMDDSLADTCQVLKTFTTRLERAVIRKNGKTDLREVETTS